jgi:cytochrome c oxidase cbb3-type subunit III
MNETPDTPRKPSTKTDPISGVETTGHEWDGLTELNNPAPRWWLWIFALSCIWAVGYWLIYPAWPTIEGYTKGYANWSSAEELLQDQREIHHLRSATLQAITTQSWQDIIDNPTIYTSASTGGALLFKENCASCHGTGAQGAKGYPNLNDDEWIWGGTLNDIYQTIQYGIRSTHDQTRMNSMNAFGKDGLLSADQINDVAHYTFSLSDNTRLTTTHSSEEQSAIMRGKNIFAKECLAHLI